MTQRIGLILSNWRDMPFEEQPTLLKTFSSGLNHQTYLIADNNKDTVLKLFSKPSSSAIELQKFAAKHKLAPRILYTNSEFDVAVMQYIENDTVSQPVSPHDLSALGNALKSLHSLPTDLVNDQTGQFDLLGYYDTYLADIGPSNSDIHAIHNEIQPVINFFLKDPTLRRVCHNDLVKENCFISSGGAQFIDWEYTQINNPWFDLATIIYSLALDQEQATSLIKAYNLNWLNKIETPIYFASQCAMLWCDILWHLSRAGTQEMQKLQHKLDDITVLKANFDRLI